MMRDPLENLRSMRTHLSAAQEYAEVDTTGLKFLYPLQGGRTAKYVLEALLGELDEAIERLEVDELTVRLGKLKDLRFALKTTVSRADGVDGDLAGDLMQVLDKVNTDINETQERLQ